MRLILAVLLYGATVAQAQTVRDVILQRDDLSIFRRILTRVGLLDLLETPGSTFTVFAPSNNAIAGSSHMSLYMTGIDEEPPLWLDHLYAACLNHIVANLTLPSSDILNAEATTMQSMHDLLTISQWTEQISGAGIETADQGASNGVLHVMDAVMAPEFFRHSFSDLELQSEHGPDWLDRPALVDIVDFVGARDVLNRVHQTGQTFVGCRIRALNRIGLDYLPQTINDSVNITVGEFFNETLINHTIHSLIEYSMITEKNYYRDDYQEGYQELIMASNGCSHMWVSVKSSRLCFNDGCVVFTPYPREYLASNGIGYVTDKCIVCSGVAMLAQYAADYTNFNVKDASQFFWASEWNLRDLNLSVGNGTDVTLFISLNSGWTDFNLQDTTRLATDKWQRHLWDLLSHMLVQGKWSYERMQAKYNETGRFNFTMLTGEPILVDQNEDGEITFGDADIIYKDIKGVDGLLHLTNLVPYPRSVTHTVYDMGKENPDFSTQVLWIDIVQLTQDIQQLLPLTGMYVPNRIFNNTVVQLQEISTTLLENMIFKELLWCDYLLENVGTRMESVNGQTWLVSVNDEGMPCFDTYTTFGGQTERACITKCDILARNGVVHYLDNVMVFSPLETRPPSPPTPGGSRAPGQAGQPSPPTIVARPTFSRPSDNGGNGRNGEGNSSSAFCPSALVALLSAFIVFVF